MSEGLSYYSYIQSLPHLSQDEIDKLYDEENICKIDLNEEINDLCSENAEEKILDAIFGKKELDEEEKKRLRKLRVKRFHKLINGKDAISRIYPSRELINKVVEGNLFLAYFYSRKYYKKFSDECSFDDLFQMSCEALLSAAKYYIPTSFAKFTTYASRCIDNKLKRELVIKEKKKYVKQDFFRIELSKANIIYAFLNSIDKNTFNIVNYTKINKAIRSYNRKMFYCFGKVLPLFKNDSSINDVWNLYNSLINESYINELVSDEDMEFIKHYISISQKDYFIKTIMVERARVKLYMFKIHCIKELIEFEKQYKKDNNGKVPSKDEQYKHLLKNQRLLNRFYNDKAVMSYNEMYLTLFNDEYFKRYDIDFLGSDTENRVCEKIRLGNVFSIYSKSIRELKDKDNVNIKYYDCSGIMVVSLDDISNSNCKFIFEEVLTKDQCLKLYNDFINEYKSFDDSTLFVNKCISNRTKKVSEYVKKKNSREVYRNIYVLDFMNSIMFHKSKLYKQDFDSIYKARITLYNIDESLEVEKNTRNVKLSLEDEVISNIFFDTYYKVLDSLTDEEKQVMIMSYDVNGYSLLSNQEIATKLGLSTNRVRGIKTRALNKIRKSELNGYLD